MAMRYCGGLCRGVFYRSVNTRMHREKIPMLFTASAIKVMLRGQLFDYARFNNVLRLYHNALYFMVFSLTGKYRSVNALISYPITRLVNLQSTSSTYRATM